MLAKDLVNDTVPVLRTSDTGHKALTWMGVFRVSHLPIVNNTEFLGLISDQDIHNLDKLEEPIGGHCLSLQQPYILAHQHLLEVMALAGRLDLSVVPVLDEKKNYLGVITQRDLVHVFADFISIKQPGAIVVLEVNQRDYTFAQIAQIVESNDVKILASFVSEMEDSTRLEVVLKLNTHDITSVLQTFDRYNYLVKASFLDDDKLETVYSERYDLLLRYLNV
jgi:CBS domain-containing protein